MSPSTPLRVALSMRVVQAPTYVEPRDSISHDWITLLDSWGWKPLLVPNVIEDGPAYLDALAPDVLILTGGDDLGQTPVRDRAERRLLAHALRTGLPVFGACRGLQLINDHFGGRLAPVSGHVAAQHAVTFSGPPAEVYRMRRTVNSFHAVGVPSDGLGEGLEPFAHDENGWVEGIRLPERPLAAVMWHPERTGAPEGDRAMIAAVAASKT